MSEQLDIHVNEREFVWEQKYRPETISEVIIPEALKEKVLNYVSEGRIPSMLFYSPSPGTGKTTLAYAVAREVGCPKPLFINASLNTSIDNIRHNVMQYATTVSVVSGSRQKVVILDECERLSVAAQESLKGIIEAVSKNCSFILTTNAQARVIAPLVSRCRVINFIWGQEESHKLKLNMCRRLTEILKLESVPYDPKAIVSVVNRFYPDNRRILGALQDYATQVGKIDVGILSNLGGTEVIELVEILKRKDFKEMSQWVMDNLDALGADFYGKMFRTLYPDASISKDMPPRISKDSIPALVELLGEEQKWHTTVADPYLHLVRVFTLVMMSPDIKFL